MSAASRTTSRFANATDLEDTLTLLEAEEQVHVVARPLHVERLGPKFPSLGEQGDGIAVSAVDGAVGKEPLVVPKSRNLGRIAAWSVLPPAALAVIFSSVAPREAFANAPVVAAVACGLAVAIASLMTKPDA